MTARPGLIRRLFLAWRPTAFPILVALCCASGDWPQWRGPQGLGSVNETGLPTAIGAASPDLRWSVEVKGDGISSPIVSNGRVFVTTAYPDGSSRQWKQVRVLGLPVLALLVLVAGARTWRRRAPALEGQREPLLLRLDGLATWAVTLVFLPVSLLAAFVPGLFPAWSEGVFGWTWFYTGGIGLVGLAAATGWLRSSSLVRVASAVLLLGCAWYLYRNIGLNSFGLSFKTRERWIMIAPAIGGFLWHVAAFLQARRLGADGHGPRSALTGAGLALMAVVLFATVNLQSRVGLVRAVLCYDFETGKQLWDAPLFSAPQEQKYEINSFATPTPCTDGKYVFAYFGSGWAGLDFDGNVLWRGRDDEYAPNTRYGCGSSPVPFEDTFIVLQEREHGSVSYIMALDKATGRQRWKVYPSYARDSYATPILVAREGTAELVTVSSERAVAHDPRSGELLWQVSLPIRQMVPSPVSFEDMILVSGGTHTKSTSSGVRLSGVGKDTRTEVLWQTSKGTPSVASPVLHDGRYFTTTDGGVVTCFEPRTGNVLWKERVAEGLYWSSLVAGDGKLFACSEEGVVTVVASNAAFAVLGRGELGENCYATPAIADGCVLVRTVKHLFCFGKPES